MISIELTPSPAAPTINQQRTHMRKHLAERYKPGEVFEVRIHLRRPHPVSTKHGTHYTSIVAGRFNDFEAAIEGILIFEGQEVDCVWTSVNKIEEQFVRFIGGWAMNELKGGATTTRDYYVNWHNWYVVDFDVLRPDDVNATEAERQAAWAEVLAVVNELMERYKFPQPIIVDSGNGFHCYWKAFNAPAAVLWPKVLHHLAATFELSHAKIDTCVGNPARVMGLAGTWNRKDANTPDRPWRIRRVVHRPDEIQPLLYSMVESIVAANPPSTHVSIHPDNEMRPLLDDAAELLDEFIDSYSDYLEVTGTSEHDGVTWYQLAECPFVGRRHAQAGAPIIFLSDTAVGFKCLAGKCEGLGFQALRDYLRDVSGYTSDVHFYEGDPWWEMDDDERTEHCMFLLWNVWGIDSDECWAEMPEPTPLHPKRERSTGLTAEEFEHLLGL